MRTIGTHSDSILGVTAAPDGEHLISASMREHVVVWRKEKRVAKLGVPPGVVCWMGAMSSKGVVAAGFGDLSVRLWEKGKERLLTTGSGIVASLAWSADGQRLVTGNCGDNTVRLWDVGGELIAQGKTKKSATWFVALSPNGKTALSGAGDKLVHVWDIERGEETAPLVGHTGKILALCFAADGKRAASAAQDRTARIWDVKKGTSTVLVGHKKQVVAVALSADGKRAATASGDRTVRLWSCASGKEQACIKVDDLPAGVAFVGDELVVAAGKQLLSP
jgi:WD40 repeat protein